MRTRKRQVRANLPECEKRESADQDPSELGPLELGSLQAQADEARFGFVEQDNQPKKLLGIRDCPNFWENRKKETNQ